MSDAIPEDVIKTAEIDAREAVRDAMIDPLMPMQFPIARYIARAILAEREACAKIADGKAEEYEAESVLWMCANAIAVRLRATASAIRERNRP